MKMRHVSRWQVENAPGDPEGPVAAYLGKLKPNSQRALRHGLNVIAGIVSKGQVEEADQFRWDQLTREHTLEVARALDDRYAPATVNKMLAALRGVLRTCRQMGLIDEATFQQVARTEVVAVHGQDQSRYIDAADLDRLFEQAWADESAAGQRDAAVLTVFMATAMRRSEIVMLDVDHWDDKRAVLTIPSDRPERRRQVPFSHRAAQLLRRWLEIRPRETQAMFLAVNKGGIIQPTRLTDQAIYEILRRLARRAGLEGIRSRDLRRTAVTRMIAKGMSLEQLQNRVGHTSWITPAVYRRLCCEAQAIMAAQGDNPHLTMTKPVSDDQNP